MKPLYQLESFTRGTAHCSHISVARIYRVLARESIWYTRPYVGHADRDEARLYLK